MHDTSPMTNLKLENKNLIRCETTANLVKAFREKCASSSSEAATSNTTKETETTRKSSNMSIKTRWTCTKCTLENEMYLTLCEACGNVQDPKSSSFVDVMISSSISIVFSILVVLSLFSLHAKKNQSEKRNFFSRTYT